MLFVNLNLFYYLLLFATCYYLPLYLDKKEKISKMAIINKNIPNIIFNVELLISLTKREVKIALIIPKIENIIAGKTCVKPLLILNPNTKKDITIKENTLITCAFFCAIDIRLNKGINIVPPPSPIAPKIPLINPINTNSTAILKIFSFFIPLNTWFKLFFYFLLLIMF